MTRSSIRRVWMIMKFIALGILPFTLSACDANRGNKEAQEPKKQARLLTGQELRDALINYQFNDGSCISSAYKFYRNNKLTYEARGEMISLTEGLPYEIFSDHFCFRSSDEKYKTCKYVYKSNNEKFYFLNKKSMPVPAPISVPVDDCIYERTKI
jgi:hypothetical protein